MPVVVTVADDDDHGGDDDHDDNQEATLERHGATVDGQNPALPIIRNIP